MPIPEVCLPPEAIRLDPARFTGIKARATTNPIDSFLTMSAAAQIRAARAIADGEGELLSLFFLQIVSGAESYFRDVISRSAALCPRARMLSLKRPVQMSSAEYYGASEICFGVLESQSLVGAGEMKRQAKQVLGLDINQGTSLAHALDQFESVCQVRHSIVHWRGKLSSTNVLELGLPLAGQLECRLDLPGFQALTKVAHNAVRAFNLFVFSSLLTRWIGDHHLSWVWERDRDRFSALYSLFRSEIDQAAPRSAYRAYRRLRAEFRT